VFSWAFFSATACFSDGMMPPVFPQPFFEQGGWSPAAFDLV
jgi:hypothetical protein